jgi:hypothetical protein
MKKTNRRFSHTSVSRRAMVERTFTSYTVGCSSDVVQGERAVRFNEFLKQFIAHVNLYGRSCSGVAPTEAEAIERAKAVCEELRERRA